MNKGDMIKDAEAAVDAALDSLDAAKAAGYGAARIARLENDLSDAADVLYRLRLEPPEIPTWPMKQINNQVKHDPDNGTYGDCHRCCYASILGLEAHQVPHWHETGHEDTNLSQQRHWLAQRGLTVMEVAFRHDEAGLESVLDYLKMFGNETPVIFSGNGADSVGHSVVVFRGEIVMDPTGSGIVGPADDGNYWLKMFSPLPAYFC